MAYDASVERDQTDDGAITPVKSAPAGPRSEREAEPPKAEPPIPEKPLPKTRLNLICRACGQPAENYKIDDDLVPCFGIDPKADKWYCIKCRQLYDDADVEELIQPEEEKGWYAEHVIVPLRHAAAEYRRQQEQENAAAVNAPTPAPAAPAPPAPQAKTVEPTKMVVAPYSGIIPETAKTTLGIGAPTECSACYDSFHGWEPKMKRGDEVPSPSCDKEGCLCTGARKQYQYAITFGGESLRLKKAVDLYKQQHELSTSSAIQVLIAGNPIIKRMLGLDEGGIVKPLPRRDVVIMLDGSGNQIIPNENEPSE